MRSATEIFNRIRAYRQRRKIDRVVKMYRNYGLVDYRAGDWGEEPRTKTMVEKAFYCGRTKQWTITINNEE